MPYTLKPNKIFAKDPNGTGYLPQNVIAENTTADMISEIEAAGNSQKNTVNAAGTTQKNAVDAAGSNQISAINSAGKTQTDAIDAKSDEIDQKMQNADSIIDRIDAAESLISELQSLIDLVHPVGSIYMSLDSTDPGQLFGGTWAQIKGRFLLSTGTPDDNSNSLYGTDLTYDGTNKYNESTPGSTGGESRHTLSESELPEHSHRALGKPGDSSTTKWRFPILQDIANTSGWHHGVENPSAGSGLTVPGCLDANSGGNVGLTQYTGAVGNNAAHNNLPPYMAVNMWRRTA